MNTYLQINHLTKRYSTTTALKGVDLCLERNQVLALLGPNGAGKSTLFGCLLGFTMPTSGEIFLNGRPVKDAERARFVYVAERVAFYPHRSVEENAVFFAELKGFSVAETERQLKRIGLASLRKLRVRQLSKGMLQRLGLAIALCGQPDLLVLDEPFNGLDPALLHTLQEVLREEQARGCTLLISTHTMSAVEPLATYVAILLHGELAAFGTLPDLRSKHGADKSLESIYHGNAVQRQMVEEVLV